MNNLSSLQKFSNFALDNNKMQSLKGGGWGNGGTSNGNGCPPPFNPGVTPGGGNGQ